MSSYLRDEDQPNESEENLTFLNNKRRSSSVISTCGDENVEKLKIILMKDSEALEEFCEQKESGSIRASVYLSYLKIGVGFVGPIILVVLFVLVQFLISFSDYWISYW
jgi:hypothetical protein